MSWETTDVLSADALDILAADTTDASVDTTNVMSARKFGRPRRGSFGKHI